MKINDVIVEAPMGILKRAGLGIKKMVPGSAGHKAQGQLDTGRVANEWKKQYLVYLGRINQQPSTENLTAFLKQLGLDDALVGSTVSEQMFIERALTKPEVDKLLLTAAQKAAAGSTSTGAQSAAGAPADDTATAAQPAAGTVSGAAKPGLLSRAASAVKKAVGVSSPAAGAAKVEPTVSVPGAAGPAAPTAPAASSAAAPAKNLDSYVNNWAKSINAAKDQNQKVALAKEIINVLKDRQGSPEASRAAAMAKATLKRQTEPAVRKIAQSSAFAMERRLYSIATRLLEATGLSWRDLGYRVLVTESTADHVMIGIR